MKNVGIFCLLWLCLNTTCLVAQHYPLLKDVDLEEIEEESTNFGLGCQANAYIIPRLMPSASLLTQICWVGKKAKDEHSFFAWHKINSQVFISSNQYDALPDYNPNSMFILQDISKIGFQIDYKGAIWLNYLDDISDKKYRYGGYHVGFNLSQKPFKTYSNALEPYKTTQPYIGVATFGLNFAALSEIITVYADYNRAWAMTENADFKYQIGSTRDYYGFWQLGATLALQPFGKPVSNLLVDIGYIPRNGEIKNMIPTNYSGMMTLRVTYHHILFKAKD